MKKFGVFTEKTILKNGDSIETTKTVHNFDVVKEVRSFSSRVKVGSYKDLSRELGDLVSMAERGEILEFSVDYRVDLATGKPKLLEKTVIDPCSKFKL